MVIPSRSFRLGLLLLAGMAVNGCAGGHGLVRYHATELAHQRLDVAWFGPMLPGDAEDLVRWRRSVGPPVVVRGASRSGQTSDRLVVINWNVHVGAGNVPRLFADVRRQAGAGVPIVFLLQEAYREGPEVPRSLGPGAIFASAIQGLQPDGRRDEVEAVAASLGLHAYYVPSMRNGDPLTSDEDRGNAILSTIPLDDLSAIELPFERQRRVAIAATLGGITRTGQPWR
ncbi:MAG: hypothetical protein ACRD15_01045, partial [Vicinamibacterales bacterium]